MTDKPDPPPPAAPSPFDVIERAIKALWVALDHTHDPEVASHIRLALRLLGARP